MKNLHIFMVCLMIIIIGVFIKTSKNKEKMIFKESLRSGKYKLSMQDIIAKRNH